MPPAEPTWRVYLAEWLIVYTSDSSGPEGVDECWDHFAGKYKGRVREDHRRVVPAITGRLGAEGPYCLQLHLPNLQSESRDRIDGCVIGVQVQRGSPAEQELLDYGKKMLKS